MCSTYCYYDFNVIFYILSCLKNTFIAKEKQRMQKKLMLSSVKIYSLAHTHMHSLSHNSIGENIFRHKTFYLLFLYEVDQHKLT